MTIDGLIAGLIMLGFATLVGIVVWLVKGRIDRGDSDLERLKGSVVYEGTCQAHREAQAQGMGMIATTLESIKTTQADQGSVLGSLATDVAVIKSAAISAAYGLNAGLEEKDYLKLMGIDVLLEVEETGSNIVKLIPVALEANPRPAGLSHSAEIIGISGKEPQPRVSTEIFNNLTVP